MLHVNLFFFLSFNSFRRLFDRCGLRIRKEKSVARVATVLCCPRTRSLRTAAWPPTALPEPRRPSSAAPTSRWPVPAMVAGGRRPSARTRESINKPSAETGSLISRPSPWAASMRGDPSRAVWATHQWLLNRSTCNFYLKVLKTHTHKTRSKQIFSSLFHKVFV